MWASIDLCLIPIDAGISLSTYIATCLKVIKKHGLDFEVGPNGTAIDGEWNELFNCVKECHEEVHKLGANRIYTTVKINTRTDKKISFREKIPNVISKINQI